MRQEIALSISGLGIIFYSPFAVADIAEGEDYFASTFRDPAKVAAHAMQGDVVSFCTGSGGGFRLVVYDGKLDDEGVEQSEFKLRLCLEVRDGCVCFRDLYDLMDWASVCPTEQQVGLENGFYKVTVYSSTPPSGIIGDQQVIFLHFDKVAEKPELCWDGVPQLM